MGFSVYEKKIYHDFFTPAFNLKPLKPSAPI